MKGREKRAERIVLDAVRELAGPSARLVSDRQADLVLCLDDRAHALDVVWVGQGYPQDIQRATRGGKRLDQTAAKDGVVVLCAVRFSPGSLDLMRRQGISYVDEAGHVRITAPGLRLVRELVTHQPAPRPLNWSAGAALTAELILAHAGDVLPPIVDMAEQLPLSPATVGKALRFFDAQGWTRHTGSARGVGAQRTVTDRPALLGSWATWQAAHPPRRAYLGHTTWRDPWDTLSERVAPQLAGADWGLTGWAAAEQVAPFATAIPALQLYVSDEDWLPVTTRLEQAGVRPVERGARVIVWPIDPQLLGLGEHKGWPLASTPRIYADLLREGGRGEGAAEHLREVALGY